MPKFGRTSSHRMRRVAPPLTGLFREVVVGWDCTVIRDGGFRKPGVQGQLLLEGFSKKEPGTSKHEGWNGSRIVTASEFEWSNEDGTPWLQTDPVSLAIDIGPYYPAIPHVHWDATREWYMFAGYVFAIAERRDVQLRWGGDWDGDRTFNDQTFFDLAHWELLRWPAWPKVTRVDAPANPDP